MFNILCFHATFNTIYLFLLLVLKVIILLYRETYFFIVNMTINVHLNTDNVIGIIFMQIATRFFFL